MPVTAFARNLELDALLRAVAWPDPTPQTVLALLGQLLAARRDQAGYDAFHERAQARPDQPLFLALEGLFQARLAARQPPSRQPAWVGDALAKLDRAQARAPGLTTYFRGLVLAELPAAMGQAEAAVADLEWVLANKERFPVGLRRGLYRALAKAYAALGRTGAADEMLARSGYPSLDADLPQFTTDAWMTMADGYHFVPPRLTNPAPQVYVAQGYDFADMAFVLTSDGIVAIDATTTEAHARAALAAARRVSAAPISHVILTHAHWDHVGGLPALRQAGTRVVARANYADELRLARDTGTRLRSFRGRDALEPAFELDPDQLVAGPETLDIGGLRFELHPVAGGETDDGLLIHLPARGVAFVGDVLMPQLGAPHMPEGSLEGLFDTLRLIQRLAPRLLVHGHTPLTDLFTIDALGGLEAALRALHGVILDNIRAARTLSETLQQNELPAVLRSQPAAVLPFLVMRDNVIARVYRQRTGYWQADGEGVEQVAPAEWAAALKLLAGGREDAFAASAGVLLDQHDDVLAHRLLELGLLAFPESRALAELRRRALDQLRERYQQLNPFKFIAYSEWAGAELPPLA
jgi:glyoxylase-like metal-dependent hydrolase (beta-lactamase superfamily II)